MIADELCTNCLRRVMTRLFKEVMKQNGKKVKQVRKRRQIKAPKPNVR